MSAASTATFLPSSCWPMWLLPLEDHRRLASVAADLNRRVAEQALDDHDVAPLAVEARVPAVDADLAEAERGAEREARLVLREDAADELPEAAPLRLLDQAAEQDPAYATAAALARDVDREVGNARVGRARRTVRRRRRPPGDGPVVRLGDDERVAGVEPALD